MNFKKYQGTGNDFILIDGRTIDFDLSAKQIELLCHRRFGIGADGLIVLKNHDDYDFEMLYHNADGKVGSMCGNGGRCTVRFAHDLGAIGNKTHFLAADGEHLAEVNGDIIHLKMGELSIFEKYEDYDFLNTGSPHYIKAVEDIENYDVFNEGKKTRFSEKWLARGGTNVNFIEIQADSSLYVRTYERGVEDETFSCGTGVTAAAIASHERFGLESPVKIKTKGGDLSVSFSKNNQNQFEDIYLIGPAKWVFDGEF